MSKFYRYLNRPEGSQDNDDQGLSISRRGFLIGAAGAGFTLAFFRSGLSFAQPEEVVQAETFEPTIWYHLHPDGRIVVNIAEAEMGQHVGTALARIVADELEADWSMV